MANQDEQLKLGIEAARRGDRQAAAILLRQVVNRDSNNELAWMWLASVVDDIQERRRCLQNALRINPNNSRAREALERLGGGAPAPDAGRQMVNRLRQTASPTSSAGGTGPGILPLVLGAVAAVVIIGAVVFGLVFAQQNNVLNPPTQVDPALAAAAAFNPTFTPTIDPLTFTDTPTPFRVIVTRDPSQADLPPTFTPTFTPTQPSTPTPTITPVPLSRFQMLYTALEGDQIEPELYRALGDGSEDSQVGGAVRDITYSFDGAKIAFVREVVSEEGGSAVELFVGPADNLGAARQITTLNSTVSSPSWSPDGIQLAFTSDIGGDDEIWIITEDGNNLRQLTSNEGITDRDPSWSPDGERIVFVSDRDSGVLTKIYSVDLNGGEPVQLGVLGGSSAAPRWSLDGTRIAFINNEQGDNDVYVMNADGSNPVLLTVDDSGAEDRAPVFSPDGRWVGFISNRQDDRFQIYMVDLRGTRVERITRSSRDVQSLDFYPDLTLRLTQN